MRADHRLHRILRDVQLLDQGVSTSSSQEDLDFRQVSYKNSGEHKHKSSDPVATSTTSTTSSIDIRFFRFWSETAEDE